jgi:class 3 adenylate cyclase/tetratricopeptide (TPR) repeat protein
VSPETTASTSACSQCGAENVSGARFCSSCGARIAAAQAAEERKLVSVLFVDLVGFTTRSDGADPEDVRDLLRLYHGEVKERIEEYGGLVEKFIGDAVMAVFGVPAAHGDDAERAVRAGLRVLESIAELNDRHALELSVRAAVNTGEAIVSPGGEKSGEALATGDVVNSAARLQTSAPVDRLIVGATTYRATRHVISYDPAEAVVAKGKAEPLEAWLAVAAATAPAERPLGTGPLVGREHEVTLMKSLWARSVAERRPQLVTVLGPPGIGKSRLCREVSVRVEADGGRIYRGRSLPYEERTGYQAFAHLIRGVAAILETDRPVHMRAKLQEAADRLLPEQEAAEMGRYLGLLLGLNVDEPVDDPGLLFFAARRFVEALGLERPTLLVFEDVHWARESELALLEYLVKHVRDTAVMLVATSRPELIDSQPSWGSGLGARTTIPLDPLGDEDASALAAAILSPADPAVDVVRLVEVAEGNPLFLEELVASVAELGEGADVPVTIREAIASRIDVLAPGPRAVLLTAAVVGRTFWRDAVAAIAPDADLDEALDVLEERDFVRREATTQIAGTAEYTFKHALIREVAYATLPRATRRSAHAAVADYVEGALEESTEMLAWVLAHHWREAGEPARAIPYLLSAAEAALRGWAQGAVVDLFTSALELAEEDDLRRHIRLRRGLALVDIGDYAEAMDELAGLLPELEGADRLDALIGRGIATHWSELHEETMEMAEQALALAADVGDPARMASATALLGQAHAMRGDEGDMGHALELGERALAEWPDGARPAELANHLHLMGDFTYWAGQYERSREVSVRARATASDAHSAEALLRGGGTEALALAAVGRHEDAIRIWDDLFALAHELGRNPRTLLNYSSLAFRDLLDLDEARRRSEEALELSGGEAFSMPLRFARSDLVLTDLLSGDVGRAQAAWPELWEDAANATAWTRWLIYGRLAAARAEIALHAESPEDAVDWAQRAREIAVGTRRRKYEGRSLVMLGEALTRLGRKDDALASLRSAVAVADELVGPPGRWEARAALARCAYALGDDGAAAAAHAAAVEIVEKFAATLSPERSQRLLAAPSVADLVALAGRPARAR